MATPDLAPLAWVQDALRKTWDDAGKALRRHLREGPAADPQHLAQVDHALRQCQGVLHLVGQPGCATLAEAMQAAVQRGPADEAAVATVEQAGLALLDYLDALLAGQAVSAVALYPSYRAVQTLAGRARIHPADLWEVPWQGADPPLPADVTPLQPDAALRGWLDQAVLRLVKSGDAGAAHELHALALGLAAGAQQPAQRDFWCLAAACFQAMGLGLLPADLHTKRIASRVLVQYAAWARGDAQPPERLAHDLLFHAACALSQGEAPTARAACDAHGVAALQPVAEDAPMRFGHCPPALLAQARKRIAAALQSWSALAAGDVRQVRAAHEQLAQVVEAMQLLPMDSQALTPTLQRAIDAPTPPAPDLALEAATALLLLDAACTAPEPVAGTDLHRRLQERQALALLAAELRRTLAETAGVLDQFFHAPREKAVLGQALAPLEQLRGVLGVLGQAAAAQVVQQLRATVDGYLAATPDQIAQRHASFAHVGRRVAALGQWLDRLGDPRALAQTWTMADDDEDGAADLAPDERYLAAADDWSAQLQAELAQWAQSPPRPPALSTVALARTLADHSAAVGFDGLAQLAGLLAQALEQQQRQQAPAQPGATHAALQAAEEIHQLLHQFAAGLVRAPRPQVVQGLQALLA